MKTLNKRKRLTGIQRRHRRVRGKVSGTPECPRMCVTRSNKNIYVQVIDDVAHKTLVGASTLGAEFKSTGKKSNTVEGALALGEIIGKKAIESGINKIVFDRGGNLYHGRVKAVAEAAREAGLQF